MFHYFLTFLVHFKHLDSKMIKICSPSTLFFFFWFVNVERFCVHHNPCLRGCSIKPHKPNFLFYHHNSKKYFGVLFPASLTDTIVTLSSVVKFFLSSFLFLLCYTILMPFPQCILGKLIMWVSTLSHLNQCVKNLYFSQSPVALS